MRKNSIIIVFVFLFLSIIFVSFLDFYPYHVNLHNNPSNIEIENKNCIYPKFFKNSDLELNEGNITQFKLISISNIEGELERDPYFISFIGINLSISFNLFDVNYSYSKILDEKNQAKIKTYYRKFGLIQTNRLKNFITFDNKSQSFQGIIETSVLLAPGDYYIDISVNLGDYVINPYRLYITLLDRFNLDISISKPNQIIVGEKLVISVHVGYNYKSTFNHLKGVLINIKIYFNNKSSISNFYRRSDENGGITIYFTIPLNTIDISFNITTSEAYNYKSGTLIDDTIKVITLREVIINLFFYFGLVILSIGVIIIISYKLIFKKKREEKRFLSEFMLYFEEMLKLEHLFIFHKISRNILLNKSYLSKIVNSKILNDFKSFIFSSDNFVNSQNSLKEISYNNKILLRVEGKFVIIGIILKDKTSDFFKEKLYEFLDYIETLYRSEFTSSNINSHSFKEIENIFEDKLNISINSPHSIKMGKFNASLLTKSYSINIYNLINEMVKETKKNSFYLSEIFSKFSKQRRKGIVEFLKGITELRDTCTIIPNKS